MHHALSSHFWKLSGTPRLSGQTLAVDAWLQSALERCSFSCMVKRTGMFRDMGSFLRIFWFWSSLETCLCKLSLRICVVRLAFWKDWWTLGIFIYELLRLGQNILQVEIFVEHSVQRRLVSWVVWSTVDRCSKTPFIAPHPMQIYAKA